MFAYVRQYDPNPKDWEALPIPSERDLPKPHNVFHRRERRAAPQRDGRPHMSKDSKYMKAHSYKLDEEAPHEQG